MGTRVVSQYEVLSLEWTRWLLVCEYSTSTTSTYRTALRDLAEHLDRLHLRIAQVGYEAAESWLESLSKRRYAGSTKQNYLAAARGFWRWLLKKRLVKHNPFKEVDRIRYVRPLPRPFTETQVNAILAAEDDIHLRALWEFFYATGARNEEARTLKRHALDLESGIVIIFGKAKKERYVELPRTALLAVRAHLQALKGKRSHSPYLFPGRGGGMLRQDTIRKKLREAARRAGIPPVEKVHPHRLRHSIATHLHNRGMDIRDLQELLGHTSIATTQVYTQVARERLFKVVRAAHPRP